MNLTDICRIFHSTAAEYRFLFTAHGTFSKMDSSLEPKASLNRHKKIEITSCIVSGHNNGIN
jgi:hypothetical protein